MALDNFRRIDMQINRANDYQIETQFVKEGDYNGRELVVQITNAGEVSNQTGVSLNLGWHHEDAGNSGLDPFTAVDASKGIFKFTYPTEMLIAGDVTASIQILDGEKITLTRNFKITVEKNPVTEDAIVSENSFTVLQEALKTVSQYDNRIANVEERIENTKTVNVLDFGAVGDGVADDTSIIQNVSNSLNDGDTIIFPEGAYRTTGTITIKKSVKIKMQGYILADHNQIGILFKNADAQGNFSSRTTNQKSILDAEIDLIRKKNSDYENQTTSIGVEMWNVYYGIFNIKRLENNNVGLKLIGNKYGTGYAGTSYCKFFIGLISSKVTNILMVASGTGGLEGYVTQNQFYSGSLSGGNNADATGTNHVFMNNIGSSVINANIFFGTSFEGHYETALRAVKSDSNRLIDCRFEMPKIKYLFHYTNSRFNQISNGYGADSHMRNLKYSNNVEGTTSGKDNYVSFIDYQLGYVEYFDDIYYIKPLSNKGGIYSRSNNGIDPANLPVGWNVEVIKNGLSDNFMYVNQSNTTDNNLRIQINHADSTVVSEDRANFPITNITFENPPTHSKEGYLFFRYSLVEPLTLGAGSNISGLVDRTGGNKTLPKGTRMIKYMYQFFTNTIYILEAY